MLSDLSNIKKNTEQKIEGSKADDLSKLNLIFMNKLSASQFKMLSEFIYKELGIKMPEIKKTMLESRLHRRLRDTNHSNFSDYLNYLFSGEGKKKELDHMFDVITTNKTDFFREPTHFDFLKTTVIPELTSRFKNRAIKIWSAGCATGEEPYTLAMVLNDMVEQNLLFDYSIVGSDISTRALKKAMDAIYPAQIANDIPIYFKKKYLLRSKDTNKPTIRICNLLRSKVNFQRINFMDDYYDINSSFDVIFCRNVIIYFDRITQEKVINKLCTKLKPDGYFFLGHSESITNMRVNLETVKPTIYNLKNKNI